MVRETTGKEQDMAYIPEHKKVAFMEALSELIESVIDDMVKEAVEEALDEADTCDEDKVREIAEEVLGNASWSVTLD